MTQPTDTDFISEDDLNTFEGWLNYQGYDLMTLSPDELTSLRLLCDEAQQQRATLPKMGLMKLQLKPSEPQYAVAVPEDGNL